MSFEEAQKIIESLLEAQAKSADPKFSGRISIELLLKHSETIKALSIAAEALRICAARKPAAEKNAKPKSGQFWRAEDERKLTELVKDGQNIKEAAHVLGRSVSSTHARAQKLGLFDDMGSN